MCKDNKFEIRVKLICMTGKPSEIFQCKISNSVSTVKTVQLNHVSCYLIKIKQSLRRLRDVQEVNVLLDVYCMITNETYLTADTNPFIV